MRYNDATYKHLPEKEQWMVSFLGYYALRKLEEKYDTKSNIDRKINASHICYDGRRIPSVRKHLGKLILSSYSTQDTLTPIDEEVEKLLAGYSIEPKFNVTGYKKEKENSYSSSKVTKPLEHRGEAYLDIDDLSAGEVIHIYLNQHLYDIQLFSISTTYRNRSHYTQEHVCYSVKVFPLVLLEFLDEAIIHAHNEVYAKGHAREILTHTYGCKFRVIKDDHDYISTTNVRCRISQVSEKVRLLQRTLKELKVLERKLDAAPEHTNEIAIMRSSMEYITQQAPLWINSEEDDKKNLAMMVLKGVEIKLNHRVN